MLEVDGAGAVISYEEYHPYGATAYWSAASGIEVSQRRYRYTGKEKDEETGFYYHGARYYAPWLGRWTSADPIGLQAGMNLFAYVRGNPIRFNDPTGHDIPLGPDNIARYEPDEPRGLMFGKPLQDPNATVRFTPDGFILVQGTTADVRNPVERAIVNHQLTGDPRHLQAVEKSLASSGSGKREQGKAIKRAYRHAGRDIRADTEWWATVYGAMGAMGASGKQPGGKAQFKSGPRVVVAEDYLPGTKPSREAAKIPAPRPEELAPAAATPKPPAAPAKIKIETTTKVVDGQITIRSEAGLITGTFDPATGNLHVVNVAAAGKRQGRGTELYSQLLTEASKLGEVKSASGYMAQDNHRALLQSKGDIRQTPSARIWDKLGFTQHEYNPKTQRAVSKPKPRGQ
jgi:RHS repeat-associated protein